MRLAYVPDPPPITDPRDQEIVQRIRTRRGSRGLLALDRTLLHAPPIADGWNSFLLAIRTQSSLPPSIRETAICRVAALNNALYEWQHHAPLLADAGELSEAAIEHIRTAPPHTHAPQPQTEQQDGSQPADEPNRKNAQKQPWEDTSGLDERHLAVLAYTDSMTRDVRVPEDVFTRVRALFSEREVVELTATVGAYNCVSRFLVALDVGGFEAGLGGRERDEAGRELG